MSAGVSTALLTHAQLTYSVLTRAVLLHHGTAAAMVGKASLPFTLRQAYPWLAVISGGLGVLVALYLILVRATRRRPTR